ncbi:MAG TPA: hypothetical protein VLF18_08650 [Tahibacter sp.]|uniref:hypothetical protein n=1 Tax=Tahibacter sp. TaxID=2056211 RepID=UPI002C700D76|nr:hypothetical protein [Tahibacter sp.]HSX60253.1 hypothetical protein [Tahibacter sp.]
MSTELERLHREAMRWRVLKILDAGRPDALSETIVLGALSGAKFQVTLFALRRELDYLEDRKLVQITGRGGSEWFAELTHYGVDLVEYAIECYPGIARPPQQG